MAMYRVSGTANASKGAKYPYFTLTIFYDHDSAANAARAYVENAIKKNENKDADVYKASIEGRKVIFYNEYECIDTFSAIVDENPILSLNVFPIKEWPSGAKCIYTYRGYDIAEYDDKSWNISASGFIFGYVSKGNIEAALQHIDHIIFESNLQLNKEDDE